MYELLKVDKGNPKIPRHFKPSLEDDEFETPKKLYDYLCNKYKIFPKLDCAATAQNAKCKKFFSIDDNALEQEFTVDTWGNHPHSLHEQFAEKYYQQWKKHNINELTIFPANCGRTNYWHEFIEDIAEYHFIKGAITFLQNGKPSKHSSRNAYLVVIWRAKK